MTNGTDSVARRAFELFLERGGVHGHDLDDWLVAERQLGGTAARKTRAGSVSARG